MTWHEVRHGLNSPGLSRSWLPDLVFGESQPSDSLGFSCTINQLVRFLGILTRFISPSKLGEMLNSGLNVRSTFEKGCHY